MMFKMPRRDPENGMRVWHVAFMVVVVALVSAATFKAMSYLPGLILGRPSPAQITNEIAVFGAVFMSIISAILGTLFLFMPGPTAMREEHRLSVRDKILAFQNRYPESRSWNINEFMEKPR